ncbi:MAG: GNAT family N-acetyltransferase [Desulfococcaceae bacterium]|nr:GNAT family N-acetyltransferase [Desulfococcaceae bacterium]
MIRIRQILDFVCFIKAKEVIDPSLKKMEKANTAETVISPYLPGAIGHITALHGEYYSRNWNFGLFFETKVATELSALLTHKHSDRNGFWLALCSDIIAGGIAIDGNRKDPQEARLRFFIVSEDYQGLGIGNLLMDKAITFCKEKKFAKVHLSTFAGLDAARHLYEKRGFRLIGETEDCTWGVVVKEQIFELVF